MKGFMTLLGIDGIIGTLVYFNEPYFLKWVLIGGIASLVALFYFTKQGKISIYGTQIVMALIMVSHYA